MVKVYLPPLFFLLALVVFGCDCGYICTCAIAAYSAKKAGGGDRLEAMRSRAVSSKVVKMKRTFFFLFLSLSLFYCLLSTKHSRRVSFHFFCF